MTKIAITLYRSSGTPITDSKTAHSAEQPLVHEFESAPDIVDALASFSSLPHCLLLDSSKQTVTEAGKSLGRYSFLMADPVGWVECRRIEDCESDLGRIDDLLNKHRTEKIDSLPPMQGGLAGLFSYDLNRAFEDVPSPQNDEFETPLIAVGLYDAVIAWDHQLDRAWLIVNDWKMDARQRLEMLLDQLESNSVSGFESDEETRIEIKNQVSVPGPVGLFSNFSADDYLATVEKAIDYIYAGDIFQVNIAQRLSMEADCCSVELYQRLRQCNPSPFGGYFDFGSGQVISASPERLVAITDSRIETRPIKGTRVRTGQPMVDINASRKLEASEKDRAENTMIVDLMRNDLSRICTDDSVRVTQLCEIENYQSVMHLVSAIEGQLKDGRCLPSELLRAIFPGGSITGAPKVRAMEIIAEFEPDARGAYCGSLGYFSASGSADLNILIRTITASKGWWQIPVGGGIVSQSIPRLEYEETWTKAAGMLSATNLANSADRSDAT